MNNKFIKRGILSFSLLLICCVGLLPAKRMALAGSSLVGVAGTESFADTLDTGV